MSRYIDAHCDESLTLADATARLTALDRAQPGFLTAASEVLVGLYNRRDLLREVLKAALVQANRSENSFYSPQSFLLSSGQFAGGSGNFTLRGNVWFPPRLDGLNQDMEDSVYSYNNCHDHNFDFLTVGYSGSGYATDIYEYDHAATAGVVGEQVPLRFIERAVLAPGKVLHFRKSTDVHVQRHPETTSISINILMPGDDIGVVPQYEFDLGTGRICSLLYSSSMFDTSLAQLVGELRCVDALDAMGGKLLASPMWQHRQAAWRARMAAGATSPAEYDAAAKAGYPLAAMP